MVHTVKDVAQMSGVTVRTLRWYDQVGLLKPAYYGDNGYRYYEEEQLLTLQQILFFRELGFKLDEIQRILSCNDFNKMKALAAHKRTLKESLVRTNELIKTTDKTILHLRGKQIMENKELYKGFHEWAEGKGTESYFIGTYDADEATPAEKLVMESTKKHDNKNLKKEDWEEHNKKGYAILNELVAFIKAGDTPSSKRVQILIKRHYAFAEEFHELTSEVYAALATLYTTKKEYRAQLDHLHPELAEFMSEAMKTFSEN